MGKENIGMLVRKKTHENAVKKLENEIDGLKSAAYFSDKKAAKYNKIVPIHDALVQFVESAKMGNMDASFSARIFCENETLKRENQALKNLIVQSMNDYFKSLSEELNEIEQYSILNPVKIESLNPNG